jgi:hypothetical protein
MSIAVEDFLRHHSPDRLKTVLNSSRPRPRHAQSASIRRTRIQFMLLGVFAMPQPLPSDFTGSFSFKPSAILQRPKLAPYIASVLMNWNEIESHLAVFLAGLLGGEARTVISVFLALQTDGGRKTTINVVTKLKLTPDDLVRFHEIQRDIGNRYSERNKAVHGAWGESPSYPDDLLWYDPRESVAAFPDFTSLPPTERAVRFRELNKSIRVYKESDFIAIIERFESTLKSLKNFTDPFLTPLFEKMNKQVEPEAQPPHK